MRRSKWVIATYAMLLFLAVSAALPNFLPTPIRKSLPSWATGRTVALGLDLQGGAHMLMAVNRDDLAVDRLQDTRETVLAEMQALGLNPATLQTDGMSLSAPMSDALMAALQSAATGTSQPGSPPDFTVSTSENTLQLTLTEAGLDRAATDAADRSLEVIRTGSIRSAYQSR